MADEERRKLGGAESNADRRMQSARGKMGEAKDEEGGMKMEEEKTKADGARWKGGMGVRSRI